MVHINGQLSISCIIRIRSTLSRQQPHGKEIGPRSPRGGKARLLGPVDLGIKGNCQAIELAAKGATLSSRASNKPASRPPVRPKDASRLFPSTLRRLAKGPSVAVAALSA